MSNTDNLYEALISNFTPEEIVAMVDEAAVDELHAIEILRDIVESTENKG